MNAIKIKYSGLPIVVITAGEPLFFRTDSFEINHLSKNVRKYRDIYHLSIDCSGMVLEFVEEEEEEGISRNKPKFR